MLNIENFSSFKDYSLFLLFFFIIYTGISRRGSAAFGFNLYKTFYFDGDCFGYFSNDLYYSKIK